MRRKDTGVAGTSCGRDDKSREFSSVEVAASHASATGPETQIQVFNSFGVFLW